jgi:hypothetical protein
MIILVGNDTLFASANISFLAPGKEYFWQFVSSYGQKENTVSL